MKIINVQNNYFITRDFKGVNHPVADTQNKEYQNNAKTIIFAVSYIEFVISNCINHYFFGDNTEKAIKFNDLILSTSFYSFSEKRKTILWSCYLFV